MDEVKSKTRRRDEVETPAGGAFKIDAFGAGYESAINRRGAPVFSCPQVRLSVIEKVLRCTDHVTLLVMEQFLGAPPAEVRAGVERAARDEPPLKLATAGRARKAARQKGRKR